MTGQVIAVGNSEFHFAAAVTAILHDAPVLRLPGLFGHERIDDDIAFEHHSEFVKGPACNGWLANRTIHCEGAAKL